MLYLLSHLSSSDPVPSNTQFKGEKKTDGNIMEVQSSALYAVRSWLKVENQTKKPNNNNNKLQINGEIWALTGYRITLGILFFAEVCGGRMTRWWQLFIEGAFIVMKLTSPGEMGQCGTRFRLIQRGSRWGDGAARSAGGKCSSEVMGMPSAAPLLSLLWSFPQAPWFSSPSTCQVLVSPSDKSA